MLKDDIWKNFVTAGLIEKGLRIGDLIDPEQDLKLKDLNYEDAQKYLKTHLQPPAYNRMNVRFRKYKQRKVNNQTTITINRNTLEKIKLFANKAQLHEDNYDLVFEFLLSPDEQSEIEAAKIEASKTELGSHLGISEKSILLKLALRLRASTWRLALSHIEYAFKMGWHTCKYLDGKKRTDKALHESTEEFMNEIKGLN